MKIERLHLKAFGGFDDHTLDLSDGNYGLHLVYGPNEAGKSTTLRAITQLLYGIGPRTNDDFLHPMSSLRIGATLKNEKESLAFFRRKGNKGTLLAEDNKTTLPDDVLAPFLGGVDEETFTHLFGLSHEQLVDGGKTLVAGEGDVGQALFSAAAGMGNLKGVLKELEDRASVLFRPRASSSSINSALSQLKKKRSAMKEKQLLPKAWSEQNEALEAAWQQRDVLLEKIRVLTEEQNRLERIQQALPLLFKRSLAQEQLEKVADAVLLPDDFTERRSTAIQALAMAKEQHQIAEANLQRLEKQLANLELDEALLAQEPRIESLHERHVVNRKALGDKEKKLDPELRQKQADAAKILRALKCDVAFSEIETLRPAPGIPQHINELSRQFQANEKDKKHAEAQRKKITRKVLRHEERLAKLGDLPEEEGLIRAIRAARPLASLEDEHATHRVAAKGLSRKVDKAQARLSDWSGTQEELEVLSLPGTSTIERFRIQMESNKAESQRWAEEIRTLEEERAALEKELDALQRAQHVPTESELGARRESRETGWRLARDAWEKGVVPDAVDSEEARVLIREVTIAGNLADAVEALTRQTDEIADRLRRESDRAARLAQLESSRDAVKAKLKHLANTQAEGAERHAQHQSEWVALWESTGITPRSPAEMAEWRTEYRAILEDIQRLKTEEAALAEYIEKSSGCRSDLVSALESIGENTPKKGDTLAEVLAQAEGALARHQKHTQQHQKATEALGELAEEIAEGDQTLTRLAAAEASWRGDWAEMMAAIGARADISPTEAGAKLELLTELFSTLDATELLEARIAEIDGSNEEYLAAVAELAHTAALEDQPQEVLVPALYAQLKEQREHAIRQGELQKQREDEATRLTESEAALHRAETELSDLLALAGVNAVEELVTAEDRARQRKESTDTVQALDERLLEISQGVAPEAFVETDSHKNTDAIAARLSALEAELADVEKKRDEVNQGIGKMEGDLAKMDGSNTEVAALADDAQGLLATLADDAREYARLTVAAHVLKEAIERYRAANQDPLLARASKIFATLTLDSFQELRADYDSKGHHVLHGVRSDTDGLVHVAGMSEGTADQLYLALRLASLERHLEKNPPIPFVLDDILVNFDDQRAAATLKVLGELSARTQVIYFTHHQHLVDLSKEHVAKKQLFTHELAH